MAFFLNKYNQDFIETGSYIFTDDMYVFKSERDRLEESYNEIKRSK